MRLINISARSFNMTLFNIGFRNIIIVRYLVILKFIWIKNKIMAGSKR